MTPRQVQLLATIAELINDRDHTPPGPARADLRREIRAVERQLAITHAMTARDMGNALYQSDVWPPAKPHLPGGCADVCSYVGRVLIGRNLMAGRTVRLDLENGHHIVCTLEKI